MSAQVPETVSSQAIADYTQVLRDLTSEIGLGMQAIAENKITELRGSLVRQQAQCTQLRMAAEAVQDLQKQGSGAEAELTKEISAARKDLFHMTRAYQGLVERGSRSASLLESLCGSYEGQYSTGSRRLRGRLHLSCEA